MRSDSYRVSVACVVACDGVEHDQFIHPLGAVETAGSGTVVIAPRSGHVQMSKHLDRATTVRVEMLASQSNPDDHDAVVLPGGVAANVDEFIAALLDALSIAR